MTAKRAPRRSVGTVAELLDRVNEARGTSTIRRSHIALDIGEDRAGPVEQWFTGELEPTFSQLAAVADYLGGRLVGCSMGMGSPFESRATLGYRRTPLKGSSGC